MKINFGELIRSLKNVRVLDNGKELDFDRYTMIYNPAKESLELFGMSINEDGVATNVLEIKSIDEDDVVEIQIETF